MFQIIAIVIGAVALGIALIGVAVGVVSGLKRSIASLIAILVAALCATLLTFSICAPTSDIMKMAMGYVVDAVGSFSVQVAEILAIEDIGNALIYYVSMIISPFFFMIVFALLSLILSAILMLVASFIPGLKKKSDAGSALLYHLGGAGVGLICGLVMALGCLFPVVGVLNIAENAVSKVPDDTFEKLGVEEIVETIPFEIISEEKYMPLFDYVGFGTLYDVFTSAPYEDENVSLKEEADVIGDIAASVLSLDFKAKSVNLDHVQVAKDVVGELDRSALLRVTLAGVASELTKEGGLVTPGMLGVDKVLTPVLEEIFAVISTSNKDTLTPDLNTLVNVVEIMVKSEILNESNYKNMLSKLGDGVIGELLIEVTKNKRMQPVADEITILSIRVLANELGVPTDEEERYNLLMKEIAYVLNQSNGMTGDEREAEVISKLGDVFSNYGMNIEGLALEHVAEGLIADLGNKNDVSGTDVSEFFAVYGVAMNETNSEASKNSGVVLLGQSKVEIVVGEDGTISIGGKVLSNYTAENYRNSAAYTMGHNKVDIGDASSLMSAETMISTLLTAAEVVGDLGHYSDCENVVEECERVGEVFSEMIAVLNNISLTEFDATGLIGGMGHALDLMRYSEIFGVKSASNIITMVLQSDTVMDSLGLKRSDMTDFANKINNFAENRENGYDEATKTIASTIDTFTKATDKFATTTEKTNATADLINNINKDNADMISSMITGDMIGSFGSVAENTDTISDSLKSLIDNMANYKEGNPDEASINKEAEAVTTILSLAIIGSNDGAMFDKKDDNGNVVDQGAVGSDPDSFIATVVESEVVMGTVTDTVKNGESNPYGVSYETEEEKDEVASALENYYLENANGNDEELKGKLQDLAIVMDVEIDLDQFAN